MSPSQPIKLRILDLYRIGPGPSSSHTVGPMRAAKRFRERCLADGLSPASLRVELLGSLAATGRGHGSDRAVLAGLCGWSPETCNPDDFLGLPERLAAEGSIDWGGQSLRLQPEDVVFALSTEQDWPHPNTMVFRAFDDRGEEMRSESWCSVGGGFVLRVGGEEDEAAHELPEPAAPFADGSSLLARAKEHGGFGAVVLANEAAWEDVPGVVAAGLDRVWQAFRACIDRGLHSAGDLPGGLGMRRRAKELYARLLEGRVDPAYSAIARGQAYAYAINEENAAGGQVVTAPTNGAAGIFPAVLVEAVDRLGLGREEIHRALATGASIAMVIKTHASISGAEVGCQGEVGSATAMAAAALCEILGGTPEQVENAAEIGLEHNLGLTCDPIKGLVQAPCIERNAMGVAKAWSAAQLALHSAGRGVVSLDKVVRTMKRTGDDMLGQYKETSQGGLAVAFPEC